MSSEFTNGSAEMGFLDLSCVRHLQFCSQEFLAWRHGIGACRRDRVLYFINCILSPSTWTIIWLLLREVRFIYWLIFKNYYYFFKLALFWCFFPLFFLASSSVLLNPYTDYFLCTVLHRVHVSAIICNVAQKIPNSCDNSSG